MTQNPTGGGRPDGEEPTEGERGSHPQYGIEPLAGDVQYLDTGGPYEPYQPLPQHPAPMSGEAGWANPPQPYLMPMPGRVPSPHPTAPPTGPIRTGAFPVGPPGSGAYQAPPRPGHRRGMVIGLLAGALVLLVVVCGGGSAGAYYAFGRSDQRSGPGSGSGPAACASGTIAVLGDITGSPNDIGDGTVNAATLAANEYHEQHPGCTVTIKSYDSDGDPEKVVPLAQQIIADNTVIGVLGPLYSREAKAATPALDKAGLPMVNPDVSLVSLGAQGYSSFHRTVGTDADSGVALARFLKGGANKVRAYLVADGSDYAINLAAGARSNLADLVVGSAVIKSGDRDFTQLAKKIKAQAATVIVFAGFSEEAVALRKAVDKAGGTDIDLYSGPGLLDTVYVPGTGEGGEDTIVVCACTPGGLLPQEFKDKLTSRTATQPGLYVGEAYDAANAFMAGFASGARSRAAMNSFLDSYSARGVTGTIAFQSGGNLRGTPPEYWFTVGNDGFIGKGRVD